MESASSASVESPPYAVSDCERDGAHHVFVLVEADPSISNGLLNFRNMLEVLVTCNVDATQVVYLGVLTGTALLSPLAVAAYKAGGNASDPW